MAHILIVEDDPFAAKLLSIRLHRAGHTVALVTTGSQVHATIHDCVPDLIVLDVLLPELNGLQVAQHLRHDPQTAAIPIVMVTALGDQRSIAAGLASGVDAYLTKPIDFPQFMSTVEALLAQTPVG